MASSPSFVLSGTYFCHPATFVIRYRDYIPACPSLSRPPPLSSRAQSGDAFAPFWLHKYLHELLYRTGVGTHWSAELAGVSMFAGNGWWFEVLVPPRVRYRSSCRDLWSQKGESRSLDSARDDKGGAGCKGRPDDKGGRITRQAGCKGRPDNKGGRMTEVVAGTDDRGRIKRGRMTEAVG